MTSKNKVIAAIAGTVASAALLLAYSLGPDVRHTAAPGDDPLACASSGCHEGTAVNGGGGSVVVNFANGQTYTPGAQQTFTIVITDSLAKVYGFQMTARLESDLSHGQAGDFTSDSHQFALCDNNSLKTKNGCPSNALVQFIEHNSPYTTNTISVLWTAPATNVGNVHIYVAGNAANGDANNTGDHIYTANYVLTPSTGAPSPAITAVVSAATFQPGIQTGSWASVFGTNLSATTRGWGDSDFVAGKLPTSLDGVSVMVDNKPAAVSFISPGQINFQPAADANTGSVNVTVTSSSVTSSAFVAQLLKEAPGFFMFDQGGRKYIAALVANSDGSATFLGPPGLFGPGGATTRPAKPGEILELYGTGFGPTNPVAPTGQILSGAFPITDSISVTIGGVDAHVDFAGITLAGLYQLNVHVPLTLSPGDQKVVATVGGGVMTPDGTFVTISN